MTCLPYYKCIDIQIVIAKFISQQLSLDCRGNPKGLSNIDGLEDSRYLLRKLPDKTLGHL